MMNDASTINSSSNQGQDPGLAMACVPLAALTTDALEDRLFEVIVESNLDELDPSLSEVDDYFAGAEDPKSEHERRRALCSLLCLLGAR
jgi:hypothetical protein